MVQNIFSIADGVSSKVDEVLWENNIYSWDDFLENFDRITCIPFSKLEKIRDEILVSKEELMKNNLSYFKNKLPAKEHYRLAKYGKIAYVDIETTGLSKYSDIITMIGIYDGETARTYVHGEDLDEARERLREFDIIVSFNGKCFDLPFIEFKFGEKYDFIHLDLRYMLKEFGLAGGLKNIERELGVVRDEEVENVDGFEAVRLWHRYKRGDEDALRKLLKYNKEDIVNLKYLLEWYLDNKLENKAGVLINE